MTEWEEFTVEPEHVGLTRGEYETLRQLDAGQIDAEDANSEILYQLEALGYIEERIFPVDEFNPTSFSAIVVTTSGRRALLAVGLFRRRPTPPGGPMRELPAPLVAAWVWTIIAVVLWVAVFLVWRTG